MSVITEPLENVNTFCDENAFEAHLSSWDGVSWLQDLKRKHWEAFKSLPMPNKKSEPWRFTRVNKIDISPFACTPTDAASTQSEVPHIQGVAGSITCVDNALSDYQRHDDALKTKGVIFMPLSNAVREHEDLVKEQLNALNTQLGSDKFLSLAIAYFTEGMFLYVPKGVVIEKPFAAYHIAKAKHASLFPITLVHAETHAQVSCMDYIQSSSDEPHFVSSASRINAADEAQIFRKYVQNLSEQSLSFHVERVIAQRNSNASSVAVNLGSQYARFESQLDINGAGASAKLYGLSVASEGQEFDQRTLQIHNAPHSTSDLLFKNALLDNARTIFSGLIKVAEEAQQTDAYQTNRNLQLSDKAEAHSLPGLEILANDVKCSHGATTGRLDESELFYMKCRGIRPEEARRLLVFGFLEEVIQKVDNDTLADVLRDLVHQKFDQIASIS